jgi:choline kinase
MNKVVLMAGEGQRFKNVGYEVPKPFIETKGKMIFVRCLESFGESFENENIIFAVRKSHEKYLPVIQEKYKNSSLVIFDTLTRGNLETAFLTLKKAKNIDYDLPLLILDSDNSGNYGESFLSFIKECSGDCGAITVFEPQDDSTKWLFLKPSFLPKKEWNKQTIATKISEKDPNGLKLGMYPAIGTFFFSNTRFFLETAEEIIKKHKATNEIYMSAVFKKMLSQYNLPIYLHKIETFIPLGTPEDLKKFEESNV